MSTKIFGILTAETEDKTGEIIKVSGVVLDLARYISDEHIDGTTTTVGGITKTKKILTEKDCEDKYQKHCWDKIKIPFVYFEGALADDEKHPDAVAAAALIKFTQSFPEMPLKVGASIEGVTFKRGGPAGTPEYNVITLCIANGVALTVRACNPVCEVFSFDVFDGKGKLQKSTPFQYDYLEKVMLATPVRHMKEATMEDLKKSAKRLLDIIKQFKPESLTKSLDDWNQGGKCDMVCKKCGHKHTLAKSSRNWSNRCTKCGAPVTMEEIWSALNQ